MDNNTLFMSFSAEVNQNTSESLMVTFSQHYNKGVTDFYLLLSSPGGNVNNGITIYNFLKSLPINLTTHNIGVVDSIANVIFLAGDNRYAVPHSSFLFLVLVRVSLFLPLKTFFLLPELTIVFSQ